jgi:hypothetical protein
MLFPRTILQAVALSSFRYSSSSSSVSSSHPPLSSFCPPPFLSSFRLPPRPSLFKFAFLANLSLHLIVVVSKKADRKKKFHWKGLIFSHGEIWYSCCDPNHIRM